MTDAVNIMEDLTDLLNDEEQSLTDCILAIIKAGGQLKEITR